MVETIPHDWIPSTLGHGESMCRRCLITNREAAVLGWLNECKEATVGETPDKEPTLWITTPS